MSFGLRLASAALLAAAVAWPAAAGAREPTESDKATARALMDQGDRHVEAGNLAEALEAYRGADAIMGVPTTGLELGKTQMKMGLLLEAQTTLLRVTRYPKKDGEPKVFTEARQEAKQLASSIAGRVPSVLLELSGLPAEVDPNVAIDGAVLPPATLGLPRRVNPGEHRLVARAPGYRPIELVFTVEEGMEQSVELAFVPETGGEDGAAPEQPGGDAPSIGALTWIGLGVGAGFLAVGAATGAVALSQGKTLGEQCRADGTDGCDPEQQADIDRATRIAHASTASFVIGGAALALGITSLILDLTGEAGAERQTRLLIGPGSLGLRGSF